MMDYEPHHNEARPRPPTPPPTTPEHPARGRPGRRRRCPTCRSTFGVSPHCPRQAGSARPLKDRFSELKVSDEEAPASSALSLVFLRLESVPLTAVQLASEDERGQLIVFGAAAVHVGTCGPGAHGLLAEAPASSSYS